MSEIEQRGATEVASRAQAKRDRESRWVEENRRHTISRFLGDFYDDPAYRVANPDRSAWSRTIENPDHPYPIVTGWHTTGPGDTRAPSEFVCEGLTFRVWWKYEGGGDRAYWDDGWWPQWSLVVRRRLKWLPFLKHDVEERVYRAASVAAVLQGTNEVR